MQGQRCCPGSPSWGVLSPLQPGARPSLPSARGDSPPRAQALTLFLSPPRLSLPRLLPALTFLGQLLFRGTSVRDIAPTSLKPVMPHTANRSRGADSLYCSSCLILIHRSQDVCYKYVGGKDTGLEMKILFFMYLLLVLSCSTFLYCRVKRWCRRNNEVRLLNMENDGFASRNIQSVCKISRCFQLVFLICWTPAFLLSLLSFTSIEPTSIFALHVAMALTMSLQGLLHSLVYGWLRQNFRQEALGETLPLRYYPGLKAFYDESFGVEC
ncbi:hypothetical protein KIL84_018226 [Mauremys mutica]|uniref:Uncharacterized protein n=1 Tax=Mauremys mutica TaxID=74926 RepID=A0A9D3XT98_9SAUR|nr:hypothetical protein KIL84_018226 [Mauremys mutica]